MERRSGRSRRGGELGAIQYVGTPRRMTVRDRALVHWRIWNAQRDTRRQQRAREQPGFYRRARQGDIDGLAINGDSWTVGDFLPEGFDAYVRLPNPFWKIVPAGAEGAVLHRAYDESEEDAWLKPVSCSEVARANGLRMTGDTGWGDICGTRDGEPPEGTNQPWSHSPFECNIDPQVARGLFRTLAGETRPRDTCLCGMWEGSSHGGWESAEVLLRTRGWNYLVWRARFRDVARWLCQPYSARRDDHLPHIVWPADRKWCLATLYSGWSSYLAGPRALVDAVLANAEEAYEVTPVDRAV